MKQGPPPQPRGGPSLRLVSCVFFSYEATGDTEPKHHFGALSVPTHPLNSPAAENKVEGRARSWG